MLSWLSDVLNPGKGIPESEVLRMFNEAKAQKK